MSREQNVRVPKTCHKNHVKRGKYLKVASVVKNYDMNTFRGREVKVRTYLTSKIDADKLLA
jgi:hypothetical protein